MAEHLTKQTFLDKVFNYEQEQELAAAFGIRSIPSLLFVPKEGQPQMTAGALPKNDFIQVIEKELLHNPTGIQAAN